MPSAAAIVCVTVPGKPATIAWCGDSRAYALVHGTLQCLTTDHNLRRVFPPKGNRNLITSYLGAPYTDEDRMAAVNHPAFESVTLDVKGCRLLLASDGAYEPLEDSRRNLADHLVGAPAQAARNFVESAVGLAGEKPDNATVLIVDLRH
ncbi:PP2C family protein-serine/threonine phosphatase [Streptomyces niveus]|uniref:PP2C family protein-serine/threonine phosphatase n=1 Tax=Streptomyces niveus TaxID=193462 RepID=UPI00342ECE80